MKDKKCKAKGSNIEAAAEISPNAKDMKGKCNVEGDGCRNAGKRK